VAETLVYPWERERNLAKRFKLAPSHGMDPPTMSVDNRHRGSERLRHCRPTRADTLRSGAG